MGMRALMVKRMMVLAGLLAMAPVAGHALDNGLAKTPPMGWNSWNKFACKGLNEQVVRQTADQIASNGMKDAGYQYVNLDDCWQTSRDAQGNIVADKERFPSGIKALADYVHSKGLKLGLYTDVGTLTCAKRPGSIGHEYQDAKQYAAWGVDYLKEDWCNTLPGQSSESSYTLMRNALAESGRPIVFSLCEWGSTKPWLWAGPVGNLWRSTPDIQDCWSCKKAWGGNGVVDIIDQLNGLQSYAGPGHWNDPDMLEIGNGGMTADEYRTHMSLWSLLAAPLIAGNDLRTMTDETKSILMNPEVIAIDQDPEYKPVTSVSSDGKIEVLMRPLHDGSVAVGLFNRGDVPTEAQFARSNLPANLGGKGTKARDLWKNEAVAMEGDLFKATVPSHGVVLLKISTH